MSRLSHTTKFFILCLVIGLLAIGLAMLLVPS